MVCEKKCVNFYAPCPKSSLQGVKVRHCEHLQKQSTNTNDFTIRHSERSEESTAHKQQSLEFKGDFTTRHSEPFCKKGEESTLKIKGDFTTRHSERSEESTAQKQSLEFKGCPNSLDSSLRATHSAQNDGVVGAYNDEFAVYKDKLRA